MNPASHHNRMATVPDLDRARIGALGYPLTVEQDKILDHRPTGISKWEAFAGCAKTSTLIEYAHQHPEPALYLAFNAAIAADAKPRFPSHVQTYTAHSYAYRAMSAHQYKDRLVNRLNPEHLDPCRDVLRRVGNMTELAVKRAILKSLHQYLISDTDQVTADHLRGFPIMARQAVLPMVIAVVDRLMDFEQSNMAFTHDIYLKAFALRGKISSQFEYIKVDEAQDLNPVLIDIVRKARRPVNIVGDPWQSIYGFRGAESAMDQFRGQRFTLSQSFRFGPEIAACANFILKQSLTPPDTPIVGNRAKDSKVREYLGSVSGKATVLARTNLRLFESLVKIPHGFHVVGGIGELISQVAAGYALRSSTAPQPKIIDPVVSRFKTWEDLVEAAEDGDEPELSRLVKIIEQYGKDIPEILTDLKNRHLDNEQDPNCRFIVSTGHKSKGREWDTVIVLDDFLTPSELRAYLAKKRIKPHEYDQEINLLYVTLTRAICTLLLSSNMYDAVSAGAGLPRI